MCPCRVSLRHAAMQLSHLGLALVSAMCQRSREHAFKFAAAKGEGHKNAVGDVYRPVTKITISTYCSINNKDMITPPTPPDSINGHLHSYFFTYFFSSLIHFPFCQSPCSSQCELAWTHKSTRQECLNGFGWNVSSLFMAHATHYLIY